VTPPPDDWIASLGRTLLRHWPPTKPRPPLLTLTESQMKVRLDFPAFAADVAGYKLTYTLPGSEPVTVDAGTDPITIDSPAGAFSCSIVAVGTNGKNSDPSDAATIDVPDDTQPEKPAPPTLTLLPNG
jgi:hypothetical protein